VTAILPKSSTCSQFPSAFIDLTRMALVDFERHSLFKFFGFGAKLQPMNERPKLPHYDPDYCLTIAKWTASMCVAVLVIEVLVLIIVDPSAGRCPGWIINATKQSAVSLWVLIGICTALPTIWICYVVFRWDHFSQKLYESIAYRRSSTFSRLVSLRSKSDAELPDLNFENIFLINFDRLFVRVSIVLWLFCTTPLWVMLANCTQFSRYLGY
jgi:hypothetical protein